MRQLIIRPGAIGDTILSFPALEHLRAGYTEIWVRSEIAPLVRFADAVHSISSTGIELFGLPDVEPPGSLIRRLRSFDRIVSWYGTKRSQFREALESCCASVQFFPALPPEGVGMHAADFYLRQVGGSGPAVPRIDTGKHETAERIVFHPFSGSAKKNWPLERFLELERVLTQAGRRVEWAAGPDGNRFDNLMDLAGWMAAAACFVGNDSGITHLAAAAGAPVVALFGPTDPGVWGPRADPVRILRARSMDEIGVETVRDAVLTLPA